MSWTVITIRGQSMAPTLNDGDYAVSRSTRDEDLVTGVIVLVNHSTLGPIVKRLVSTISADSFALKGDNILSSTSERLGLAQRQSIVARLVWRISESGIERL